MAPARRTAAPAPARLKEPGAPEAARPRRLERFPPVRAALPAPVAPRVGTTPRAAPPAVPDARPPQARQAPPRAPKREVRWPGLLVSPAVREARAAPSPPARREPPGCLNQTDAPQRARASPKRQAALRQAPLRRREPRAFLASPPVRRAPPRRPAAAARESQGPVAARPALRAPRVEVLGSRLWAPPMLEVPVPTRAVRAAPVRSARLRPRTGRPAQPAGPRLPKRGLKTAVKGARAVRGSRERPRPERAIQRIPMKEVKRAPVARALPAVRPSWARAGLPVRAPKAAPRRGRPGAPQPGWLDSPRARVRLAAVRRRERPKRGRPAPALAAWSPALGRRSPKKVEKKAGKKA